MHELSIAHALIEMADEAAGRAAAGRVTRLHCRVGALRQIENDLLIEAFEQARRGTRCADAALEIEHVPLRARCDVCGVNFVLNAWDWHCPCCSADGRLMEGGDELELVSIDAEVNE